LGIDGDISANVINELTTPESILRLNDDNEFENVDVNFITNLTTDAVISGDYITITNSEASISSSNPQTIELIKKSSRSNLTSQFRNVTKNDYISHLEGMTNVSNATVWGEREENSGNTLEYNKIYISIIPTT
jgi:hypothetical protein